MAATMSSAVGIPSSLPKSEFRIRSRRPVRVRSQLHGRSEVASLDRVEAEAVAGGNGAVKKSSGGGPATSNLRAPKTLELFYDDGYGIESVIDYLEASQELIKPDGGPPRWFCPVECRQPIKDAPVLLFLPGTDGVGLGLILHQKALGLVFEVRPRTVSFGLSLPGILESSLNYKSFLIVDLCRVFEVRCLHIPVNDRTRFEGLVEFVESMVRLEHAATPNKPIYIVGDSFGGCLALAVAARNPSIDLVLVLSNPATSFGKSPLQPWFPALEALSNELHATVPYLLSFIMGDPVKMAMANIDSGLSPQEILDHLLKRLTSMLPRLSVLAEIIPKETLLWKLRLLKSASLYANSRLHAVKAEVLVLASGKDNLLPSKDEAERLYNTLPSCKVRYFKDNGHTLLLEDGISLLSLLKATNMYRRSRQHDFILDYLPPSVTEFQAIFGDEGEDRWFNLATSPVVFSTLENGQVVRGLAGVPDEGPVLLVGYHMLLGLELAPIAGAFLKEKNVMIRGVAHPMLFSRKFESSLQEVSRVDHIKVFGAVPVSATNMYKLFSSNSFVLLYPGGAREALHRKGEEYKLFWPDQPEFVRMAARFGAKIVPFGSVGEDDIAELILDYNDQMNIPLLREWIKDINEGSTRLRTDMSGEIANQDMFLPGLLPKMPGRFYYLFGKPIETKGREEILKDKKNANELYLQIKLEVENMMSYLKRKREEDPYRGILQRTIYQATGGSAHQVPSFDP